jgi:tetratricopeptide (TPR) repeat protein
MKLLQLLFILFNLCPALAIAQKFPFDVQKVIPDRDSMLAIIREPKDDLDLIQAYREMGFAYYESKRDSALYFYEQSLALARTKKWKLWEADAANSMAFGAYILGDFPQALQLLQSAKAIAENPDSEKSPGLPAGADPNIARLRILQRTYWRWH